MGAKTRVGFSQSWMRDILMLSWDVRLFRRMLDLLSTNKSGGRARGENLPSSSSALRSKKSHSLPLPLPLARSALSFDVPFLRSSRERRR